MGSSNVLLAKIKKEVSVIKALIKANDYVYLVCGFDQNGNPHIADFGTQKEIFNKLTGEPLDALVFTLDCYFEMNDLPFLSMMSETVASRKLVSYKRAIKDMKNDEESSYQGRAKS